jgi:hypothetical protein
MTNNVELASAVLRPLEEPHGLKNLFTVQLFHKCPVRAGGFCVGEVGNIPYRVTRSFVGKKGPRKKRVRF